MMKITAFLSAMLLALLAAGCATQPADTRLVLEPALRNKIVAGDIATRRAIAGDLTEAKVELTNTSALYPISLERRADWTDAQGFSISSVPGNWTDFTIPPKGRYIVNIVGPTPAAVNFCIYIQEKKPY